MNKVLKNVDAFFDAYAPVIMGFAWGFFFGVMAVIISEELFL
jgi:hypothetical protein